MFFPELIQSIEDTDRVLEIGPGGIPYQRSDVFLDLKYESDNEAYEQRAKIEPLKTDKPIIYYDGVTFPFKDKEFDYIICSHVIEHVEDPEHFLSEIFRVGRKGYIEFPTIRYEYLYNFNTHKLFVKKTDNGLIYYKKSETHINEFRPVQDFFEQVLILRYDQIITDLMPYMFEGFEWKKPFQVSKAENISDFSCSLDVGTRPVVDDRLISIIWRKIATRFFKQ